jgi:hypothetical protein
MAADAVLQPCRRPRRPCCVQGLAVCGGMPSTAEERLLAPLGQGRWSMPGPLPCCPFRRSLGLGAGKELELSKEAGREPPLQLHGLSAGKATKRQQ